MPSLLLTPPLVHRDADRWFRSQGLPAFVPVRRWFADIARRAAPLVVAFSVLSALAGDGLDDLAQAIEALGTTGDGKMLALGVLIYLVFVVVASWTLQRLVRAALRRLDRRAGMAFAALVIALATADVFVAHVGTPPAIVDGILAVVASLGLPVLFVAFGGGALVAWAGRLAVRNLFAMGRMATIALPVILMLVLFAFFAAEIWQMGSLLSMRSFLLLSLVVAALAALVVLRVSAVEVDTGVTALTAAQRADLLCGTPAEGRTTEERTGSAVGVPQRLNMLIAIVLAQLIQAAFFAMLLAALLIVIGAITVPPSLVQTWIGGGENPPKILVEPVIVQGLHLPLTMNLLKSAALLAVISALPFVFSTVSESRYREAFFEPIVADMRRAILVRAALHDTDESGPPAAC